MDLFVFPYSIKFRTNNLAPQYFDILNIDGEKSYTRNLYYNEKQVRFETPMSLAMPVVDCEYIDNEEISAELAGEKDLEDYRAKGNMLALNKVLGKSCSVQKQTLNGIDFL